MIVNNMCNNSTLNNVDFWGTSIINTTNNKIDDYTYHQFKKRLKIKSNRSKRLQYNDERLQDIKNNRDKR